VGRGGGRGFRKKKVDCVKSGKKKFWVEGVRQRPDHSLGGKGGGARMEKHDSDDAPRNTTTGGPVGKRRGGKINER